MGELTDVLVSLDTARLETLVVLVDAGFLGLGEDETRRVDVENVKIDPVSGTLIVPAAGK